MGALITSKSIPAKAIRIVLVFALVFWASFRVECLAFGAVVTDSLSNHKEGTLNDVELWQVESIDGKELKGDRVSSAGDTADGKNDTRLQMSSVSGIIQVVAIPAWQPSSESSSGQASPAAASDDMIISDYLDWNVDKPECVDLKVEKGVVTITGKAAGTVTVTCSLKASDEKYVSADFKEKHKGKPFEASFKIDVLNPEVKTLELLSPNGEVLVADQTVSLTEEQRESYAFGARVTIADPLSHETIAVFTDKDRSSLPEGLSGLLSDFEWSLKSNTGDEVGEDVATIGSDGVLHMEKDAAFIVNCSMSLGEASSSAQVHVTSGNPQGGGGDEGGGSDQPEEDDGQGAWRPQRQLRVIANLGAGTESGSEEGSESSSSANPDGQQGGSESSSSASSKSAESADAESPSQSSESPSADESKQSAPKSIDKLYGVDDLQALGTTEAMYSMYGSNGWQVVRGSGPSLASLLKDAGIEDVSQIESITFEGLYGTTEVAWSDLTAARSYYPHALEGSYADGTPSSPMVAILSYQYSAEQLANGGGSTQPSQPETPKADEGSSGAASGKSEGSASSSSAAATTDTESGSSTSADTDAGGEGEKTEPELVDNTQFRLLFGATEPAEATIEPDSLRWIHTIHVNMKSAPTDDAPTDPTLRVRVGYVPAPLGYTAVFSAIPNNEIGNARFGFHWQESSDGVTWTDVPNGAVQTLRIPTTEDRLGHQFRVIMETDLVNEEGKKRGATSEPATMVVGSGFAVSLAYDPPRAGDTAIFQSTVYGDVDASSVTYEWQSSIDGGETWTTVPNRTGPQLAVPTNPIEKKPEGSGDSGASSGSASKATPITYVRVIARAADGREAYSNVMPLTVRVGDSDDESSGDGQQGTPGSGSGSGQPSNPTDGGGQTPGEVTPATPNMTVSEIDHIVYEETNLPQGSGQTTAPEPSSPTTEQTGTPATAPTAPATQTEAPEIFINPDVSAQITQQVQAARDNAMKSTPGARWTEINAVNPGGEDVRRVLADNPFAPFAIPLGLGLVVAGGFERFLSFRRALGQPKAN